MFSKLEQLLGAMLLLGTLADVFVAVLYARMGTALVTDKVTQLVWRFFRATSKLAYRRRAAVLSFCGPAILIILVVYWMMALTLGSALIIHPALGSGVRARQGETPRDFVTALYTGGASITAVGSSDYGPQTPGFRLFFLFNSLVGTVVVSLTLTCLMQVYSASRQRCLACAPTGIPVPRNASPCAGNGNLTFPPWRRRTDTSWARSIPLAPLADGLRCRSRVPYETKSAAETSPDCCPCSRRLRNGGA
jgi:hypothetical protein